MIESCSCQKLSNANYKGACIAMTQLRTKPANVMVRTSIDRIRYHSYGISGLSRLKCSQATGPATIKISKGSGTGTVPYIAPEMLVDAKRSWQADIYSFGRLLIELNTGKQVYRVLDAGQIIAKVCGTYTIAPQPPSTLEVPPLLYLKYHYRGDTFRQAFSEIGDIRSLIPDHVQMMALTATATKNTRINICHQLGKIHPFVIAKPPNRVNIIATLLRMLEDTFTRLVENLHL